jgi:hypothetical protein
VARRQKTRPAAQKTSHAPDAVNGEYRGETGVRKEYFTTKIGATSDGGLRTELDKNLEATCTRRESDAKTPRTAKALRAKNGGSGILPFARALIGLKPAPTMQLSLAVQDVDCPFLDIKCRFSDRFAQSGMGMSGAAKVFGASAEFNY